MEELLMSEEKGRAVLFGWQNLLLCYLSGSLQVDKEFS